SDKEVELSHTIFYAESGGQESDAGTIDGIPVVGAIKSGSRIVYTLERQPTFRVGDQVIKKIDGRRRYALITIHNAAAGILDLV
ncbi:alanine--tRNA ligase-related protein, partial [Escherichia coli]|nr:alanine--tRNA ligase-related protein [Escherichia coli]